MPDILNQYRQARSPLPGGMLAWQLRNAGLENLGTDGRPDSIPLPQPGPGQLLLRVDALGLCFSDIKLITQGSGHPRISGRDLAADPAIPGHEAALTVVKVGPGLERRFNIGDRFIIQADVFYRGASIAYGYVLPGAMAQYSLVGPEILEGDEGCYLLPVQPQIGYAEAALIEPWACVEASYRLSHRTGLQPGGACWIIGPGAPGASTGYSLSLGDRAPASIMLTQIPPDLAGSIQRQAEASGIPVSHTPPLSRMDPASLPPVDDIIVLEPSSQAVQFASPHLARQGVMALIGKVPLSTPVEIDLGRIHYDHISFVGGAGPDIPSAYQPVRSTSEISSGGCAWFIGAGGPMGQMHVQRAVSMESPPSRIVISDLDSGRLENLRRQVAETARRRKIELACLNPAELGPDGFAKALREQTSGRGFDDIVLLAPVPALAESAFGQLAPGGMLNLFAGLPRGTKARLDLSPVYCNRSRLAGSSGSAIADLQTALAKTESGRISPNSSVAAISGMRALSEGLQGVKEGRFPGKVVIFPQLEDLPLLGLSNLGEKLPSVAARMAPGPTWTTEAEQELLRLCLPSCHSERSEESRPRPSSCHSERSEESTPASSDPERGK